MWYYLKQNKKRPDFLSSPLLYVLEIMKKLFTWR